MKPAKSIDPEYSRSMPKWVAPLGVVLAIAVLAAGATPAGQDIVGRIQFFFSFFAGVVALVGFSLVTMVGLLCTDRIFLSIKHRVMAQALHRSLTLVSVTFLFGHIAIKVLTGQANIGMVFLPWLAPDVAKAVGPVAAWMMLGIAMTGVLRGRFAAKTNPTFWRVMHAFAYMAWPLTIWHGLVAGRPARGEWVIWSYVLCMVGVLLGVLMRLLVRVQRPAETSDAAPVGQATLQRQSEPIARQSSMQARVADRMRAGK